jgi:predicted dehydrogenase
MAMEDDEALQIVRAVRTSGIRFCVDYNRRMSPALQALRKRWLEVSKDDTLREARRQRAGRDLLPDECRSHLLVRIQDESATYRMVHLDPLRGGGQVIGESVHWLDLARWFFAPAIPVEILAWGSTRFSHGIRLTFTDGHAATILFNCEGSYDYPKELYEVTAGGILLRNEYFVENAYYGLAGSPEERERFPFTWDSNPEAAAEGGMQNYLRATHKRGRERRTGGKSQGTLNVDKGHAVMLDAFVAAILEDRASPCDETDGRAATFLALLAIQSIHLRQALPVPEDLFSPCLV